MFSILNNEVLKAVMRKKNRWRLAYGLGLLLKCVEVAAQCNGQAQTISTVEPLVVKI